MRIAKTAHSAASTQTGFSLLELLVAVSLLTLTVLSVVQLLVYTARSGAVALRLTMASAGAADKLDQLRTLAWFYGSDGVPVTDLQADLTISPEQPGGGVGLRPSPPGTLDRNIDGYFDFLDARGRPITAGSSPPDDSLFVRRWAVTPLAASPADGLVIQVRLLSREASRRGGADVGEVTLSTIRARLAR